MLTTIIKVDTMLVVNLIKINEVEEEDLDAIHVIKKITKLRLSS